MTSRTHYPLDALHPVPGDGGATPVKSEVVWVDCPNCKSPMRADRDECRNCGHDVRGLCRYCGQTHCTCDGVTRMIADRERNLAGKVRYM